jgi:hypothetical protein
VGSEEETTEAKTVVQIKIISVFLYDCVSCELAGGACQPNTAQMRK